MNPDEIHRHEQRLREVARLYWIERRSQAEIAQQRSLSRTTVSRLLDEARRRGIIRFRLADAHDRDDELETALAGRWLEHGRRVDVRVGLQFNRNVAEDDHVLGRLAARTIAENLVPGERRTVAIASSRTMAPILPFADAVGPLERVSELLGISSRSAAPSVGTVLAERTGAAHDSIDAPFVHRDVNRAQAARDSVELADELSRARRATVALVGANTTQRFDGTGAYSPVSPAMLAEGAERGAVGHVCGWFLDAAGARVSSSLDALRVGIEPDDFRTIRSRVLLCWGPDRAPIIAAAVAAGLCTGVVTDASTAQSLLTGVNWGSGTTARS